ncbi:beta-lactamase-like protein [Coniochaeta sp. 2T2.1]|nr:beta-lactamase-like protein [Coniochaeta sp. 2T2.1]
MPVQNPEEPSTSQETHRPERPARLTPRGHTLTPAMWSNIPSGAVATLSIIDTTLHLGNVGTRDLMAPAMSGFDILPAFPTWSFLLESSTGKKAVFDLGVAHNLDSYSPRLSNDLKYTGWTVETAHDVADILKNNGVDPSDINDVIWSHEHFDHIGDISRFPNTTNLIVGPGFKETNLPAWPTNPYSQLRDDYFEGRNVIQMDFEKQSPELQIGPFNAFDLWGDGAVYLLSTPGHTQSHLGALVRTTNQPERAVHWCAISIAFCFESGEKALPTRDAVQTSQAFPIPPACGLDISEYLDIVGYPRTECLMPPL